MRASLPAALMAAAVLSAACGHLGTRPSPRDVPPRNLLMVVIDTLRADHLGCYGYERNTSPNLDRLAAEGALFENAVAPSSWTAPSIASLFTSSYPSAHATTHFTAVLPESFETLAEVLSRNGFRTGAISANYVHINPQRGFGQGFQSFQVVKRKPAANEPAAFMGLRPGYAHEVADLALDWLMSARGDSFFLYVHFMDPHSSYHPPEEYRRRFVDPHYRGSVDGTTDQIKQWVRGERKLSRRDLAHLIDLYDGEVAFVDAEVGRLLAKLERMGRSGDTLVVVLSDHGEELGDHGSGFHGMTLYEEVLHVPLIMRVPGQSGGVRVAGPVSLVDVTPTILDLMGLGRLEDAAGVSLVAALGTPAAGPRGPAHAELHEDPAVDKVLGQKVHRAAVRDGSWKLLAGSRGVELYELGADPDETRNLSKDRPAVARRLLGVLEQQLHVARGAPDAGSLELGKELEDQLRALGYLE